MSEPVRTPIGPDARLPKRRTLDERIFVRRPAAYVALSRAVSLLQPRSRLRRALLRRAVLSGWGAWSRGDLQVLLVRYAPHCCIEPTPDLIAAGMRSAYHGQAGLREWASDTREVWERLDLIPQEIFDAGNPVVLLGQRRLRARGSGIEFEAPIAIVCWMERGLITQQRDFIDWEEGLRAAVMPAAREGSGHFGSGTSKP